ncbi:MAG: glutamate-1-semialdehyde 2,1-aminomutase [Planctomycetes bacterium]|nr:glutamate-1-semialdehyde 2,1-aminomutase [Planctomycetota bacterium]
MRRDKSVRAFGRACKVLVGGVDSPVRAFAAVGGGPAFIERAAGPFVYDLDGNRYIDYVGTWGPAILGHAHPAAVGAIASAVRRGSSFGAPCQAETRLATLICRAFGSVKKVRFVSSGTEAVMTAVRLARGATGRDKIIKFAGCYHGHSDALLVAAGSGATTLGIPSSAGVPAGAARDTLTAPYNDPDAVGRLLKKFRGKVAAVLVEPAAGNMGVVAPAKGFLSGLRKLCDRHGALLIFDEVMTGFRLARGGAQELYGVRADITTLGKIIGGGMPVGAVGGPAKIMDNLAPLGRVYQAGTLSGNPVAMAAGIATLELLQNRRVYADIERAGRRLETGLLRAAASAGLRGKICVNRVGSMMTVFFRGPPVRNYADATGSNIRAFAEFFHAMADQGIYLPPSQYEAWFISARHGPALIDRTIRSATKAFTRAARLM